MSATAVGELCPIDEQDQDDAPRKPTKATTKATAKAVIRHPDPTPPQPPARRPAPAGLPDPEADPAVVAARARCESLTAQLVEATAARRAAGERLGIDGPTDPARLERIAERLVADGCDPEAIEEYERRVKAERRIYAACKIAAEEVKPALDAARRRLQPEAQRTVMQPLQRGVALARLALARAVAARDEALWQFKVAGFDPGQGVHGELVPPELARQWIAAGIVSREEAAEFLV